MKTTIFLNLSYFMLMNILIEVFDIAKGLGGACLVALLLSSFASNGLVLPPLCSSLSTNHLFLFCQSSSFLISNKESFSPQFHQIKSVPFLFLNVLSIFFFKNPCNSPGPDCGPTDRPSWTDPLQRNHFFCTLLIIHNSFHP